MWDKFSLLRSSHHDFNQDIRPPQRSLDANTSGWILSVNPIVPNGVVVFKVFPVRQPYVSGQEFRFVGACLLQKTVDGFKHLFGLNAHIADWLGRHTTGTNNSVVDYDQADQWEYVYAVQVLQSLGRANALDGHLLTSGSLLIQFCGFVQNNDLFAIRVAFLAHCC
jgi:hypothetical protein